MPDLPCKARGEQCVGLPQINAHLACQCDQFLARALTELRMGRISYRFEALRIRG